LGFLIAFNLFWNGIVGMFVMVAFSSKNWEMLAAISLHTLVGLGMFYWLLTLLFNKTKISVTSRDLTVRHGPLKIPFYKSQELPVDEIAQLYCQKYMASKTNGKPDWAYQLCVITQKTEDLVLIKNLPKYSQALYLEQEIELFLQIDDEFIEDKM
ncbi:MAG: hypothetical protein ACPGXL_08595, partial [Chitinophagales bacterium]